MKLSEVRISVADVVYRESPWNKVLAVLMSLIVSGVPFVIAVMSGNVIFYIAGAFGLLFVGVFGSLLVKTLRPDNWLMRITSSAVVVKYRSFANAHLPKEDLVAFVLDRAELKWARSSKSKRITPGSQSGESRSDHRTSLEIGIDPSVTQELEPLLVAERQRQEPPRGMTKSSSKTLHYPVSIPESGVIRIEWRSGQSWITPSIKHVLAQLAKWTTIEEPKQATANYASLTSKDMQTEDKILELAASGEVIAATRLVRKIYGYSLAEARQFVDDLIANGGPRGRTEHADRRSDSRTTA